MSQSHIITLVFFSFILIINQLKGDTTVCEERAILDIAVDAIVKAKDLYPICKEIENDGDGCGIKEKSFAYLEVAKNLISAAKEHYPTCNKTLICEKDKKPTDCSEVLENGKNGHSQWKTVTLISDKHRKPTDCSEVLENGHNVSGVYTIWPKNRIFSNKSLVVYCDMDTENGGWTVIQRRGKFTEQEDFFRNWEDYKLGFGYLKKDFWLGNDNIYALSNQEHYTVRFDLEDAEGNKRYAIYNSFWIDDENSSYRLHITNYSGNAGDSMAYHNGHVFSTKDRPKDIKNIQHCALDRKGGWWYDYCTESNLNGIYQPGVQNDKSGITWYSFKGEESLASVEIKLRSLNYI